MGLLKFIAPNLPVATVVYNQEQNNQLLNALRLYFNRIDTAYWDGARVVSPHGSFFSTATQTAASTTVAYPITYTNTDAQNGVTLSNNSRLSVNYPGVYNIQYSLQLSNSDNNSQDIEVWLRINGVDVANSNTRFGLAPRKSVSDPFHAVGAANLFATLAATDYVELAWETTSTNASIQYYAAGTSPTRPAIPSAIVTLSFVSALP